MKALSIKEKSNFVGRKRELERLTVISKTNAASIIIMYGRRRVGKTELLEQAFRNRNILKFEGIEGLDQKAQLTQVIGQLAAYVQDLMIAKLVIDTWQEFFMIVAKYTAEGTWTIYLEELQWLADYKSTLVAELKYVWDNYFRQNNHIIVVLCGSAPSFMLEHVVHSKALYNRSQYEFHLKEFTLIEAKEFLGKRSNREVVDAYLAVGGLPEYLKKVGQESSVFLGLCNNAFASGGFFVHEYERIFTSNMSENKHYKEIIQILSTKKFATRKELALQLNVTAGGSLTDVLIDLEKVGFITSYHPFNLGDASLLVRYAISDNYLQFYFKFIKPIQKNIEDGAYDKNPVAALSMDSYVTWLGFAFERFCRKYHYVIAGILGFSAVRYSSGAFFSRATDSEDRGYQIDLIFDRADNVYTICEIKYLHGRVGTSVIDECEKKLSRFPRKSNKTIHKVLICTEGADEALAGYPYFDAVITFDQLFDNRYW